MKLSERVDNLEHAMEKHLEESGEIRSDLKWLKKLGWFLLASPFATEAVRHIWK